MAVDAARAKSLFLAASDLSDPVEARRLLGARVRRRRRAAGPGRGPAPGQRRLAVAVSRGGRWYERARPGPPAGNGRLPRSDRPRRLGHCGQVQADRGDRRGRHGQRLHGPADRAREAGRRGQGHQGRHGLEGRAGPVRGGAAGAGDDGSPEHRQGARRRHHRRRPAVLRHGTGQGRADHPVLRRAQAHAAAAAGTVRAGVPGDPARPPEGRHPPRHQAVERAGGAVRRPAGAEGDRLRRGEGRRAIADGQDADDRVRGGGRHAGVHVAGAGEPEQPGHRHPQRRVLARRAAVRTADRHARRWTASPWARRRCSKSCGSSARSKPRGRAPSSALSTPCRAWRRIAGRSRPSWPSCSRANSTGW